jgi:hypothetical protein
MPQVDVFTFIIPPPPHRGPRAKPRRSAFKLSLADGPQYFPGAVADLSTREVRMIGDGQVEAGFSAGIAAAGGGAPGPRMQLHAAAAGVTNEKSPAAEAAGREGPGHANPGGDNCEVGMS